MSFLASFYLIPATLGEQLAAAAEAPAPRPVRSWNPFKPKAPPQPDPLLAFLDANARELADFPYNGNVLIDAELLAPAAFTTGHPLGERLSAATGGTYIAYTPALAAQAIAALRAAEFSQAAIDEALRADGRGDEDSADYETGMRDGVARLIRWLEEVGGADVGLLCIG